MNSLYRTVQLPTKEIILLIFFEKFPVMQLREELHHLTKTRHVTFRLSLTALLNPPNLAHLLVTDFQHTRCLPKEK
jgi:hypothetical protein